MKIDFMKVFAVIASIMFFTSVHAEEIVQEHAEEIVQEDDYTDYYQEQQETVVVIGDVSFFGDSLIKDRQRIGDDTDIEVEVPAFVYVNGLTDFSKREKRVITSALANGSAIVLDNTDQVSLDDSESVSLEVLGFGFTSPVLVAYLENGSLSFVPITYIESTVVESTVEMIDADDLIGLVGFTEAALVDYREVRKDNRRQKRVANVPYRPMYNTNVKMRYNNRSCYLPKAIDSSYTFGTEGWDPCDGNASINLVFQIDMARSVPGSTTVGYTSDEKYVRVSLPGGQNEPGAGSGFFIRDNLIQKNTWFQSWAHRNEWFGPYARQYEIKVAPKTGTDDVSILNHIPKNVNPLQTYMEITGFNVGMGVKGTAEVGSEGPKVGGEVGAEFGFKSERRVTFETHEYRVQNATNNQTARWIWDRNHSDNMCDWITSRDFGACLFTRPLWSTDWVVKKSAFTPISHSNYTPGMSVTYSAPSNKRGTTRFRMDAIARVDALGAKVIPSIFYWQGFVSDVAETQVKTYGTFTINWEHPAFEPEAHVRLRSLDANDIVLRTSSVYTVFGYQSSPNVDLLELWGYDSKERYKSRSAPNKCLAVMDWGAQKGVLLETCNNSNNQKWYWQGDRLYSRYYDSSAPNNKYVLAYPAEVVPDYQSNKRTRWKPYLQNLLPPATVHDLTTRK